MSFRPTAAVLPMVVVATLVAAPTAGASDVRSAEGLTDLFTEHAQIEDAVVPGVAAAAATSTNSWIATFKDDVPGSAVDAAAGTVETFGGTVGQRWQHAVVGLQFDAPRSVAERVVDLPGVALVESNDPVTSAVVEDPAVWGLDRINQRDLPLDGYYEVDQSGAQVRVYVIDSGIRPDHAEFGDRVLVEEGGTSIRDGFGSDDCNGHGTHVAGTVGGATHGVAQQVLLVPMRVLDCQGRGSEAGIISALDHLAGNAVLPAVANMSLGGYASSTIDAAAQTVVDAGVTLVTASGNEFGDACHNSPGRLDDAINVGATEPDDSFAAYSNAGSCVDLLAPGSDITSASAATTTGTALMSGTSMASPHVAGVAALALGADPTASPAEISRLLTSTATTDRVTGLPSGTPNLLLHAARDASDTADGTGGGTVDPTPSGPDGCADHGQTYTGNLREGSAVLLPPTQDYRTTERLLHEGCLDGPSGTDFDLGLVRYNESTGQYDLVDVSESTGPDEQISADVGPGDYAWIVYAYGGTGDFQMGFTLTDESEAGGNAGSGGDGHDLFVDVHPDNVFTTNIGRLAAAGVTRGCNPPANDRFCPEDPVTRGQMAAFLTRALDLPPSSSDWFGDDDGSVFEANIQALAASGVTRGCNPPTNDRFCPADAVTRQQMAAFLDRAGLLDQ